MRRSIFNALRHPAPRPPLASVRTQHAVVVGTDLLFAALLPPTAFLVFTRAFHLSRPIALVFAAFLLNGLAFLLYNDLRSLARAARIYREGALTRGRVVSMQGPTCVVHVEGIDDRHGDRSGRALFVRTPDRDVGETFPVLWVAGRSELVTVDGEGKLVPGVRADVRTNRMTLV